MGYKKMLKKAALESGGKIEFHKTTFNNETYHCALVDFDYTLATANEFLQRGVIVSNSVSPDLFVWRKNGSITNSGMNMTVLEEGYWGKIVLPHDLKTYTFEPTFEASDYTKQLRQMIAKGYPLAMDWKKANMSVQARHLLENYLNEGKRYV